jgi:hypothetical protein
LSNGKGKGVCVLPPKKRRFLALKAHAIQHKNKGAFVCVARWRALSAGAQMKAEEALFESKMPGWTSSSGGGGRGESLENRPAHTKKDDAHKELLWSRAVIALMFAARLSGSCGQNCTAGRANHK